MIRFAVLSKLLERLVARQLLDHLAVAKLLPELQSAYRPPGASLYRNCSPQGF